MKYVKSLKTLFVFSLPVLAIFIFASARSWQLSADEMIKGKPIVIGGITYTTIEGTIDVPEDYTNPSGRRLQLPFFVVKSNSEKPAEPIFWLDGGPGGSNILNEKKIAVSSPAKLLANHDLVCVGYRGVDGSTVLKSDKVNKAMKGLHHKMLSDESLNNIEVQIKKYCTQLKNDGIDINNYTILQVIEDMEQVRKLLNYQTINIISASYGTRVALLYSYKYPEVLKRTVMIGACPPGYFLTRPEQAEFTLAHYDSLYQLQYGQGSIRDAMRKAFQQMPKRWSGFRLDADKIKTGTMIALYARDFAMVAFDAYFKAVNKGDYSGLFLLQKIQDMNSGAVIGDIFSKTVSADIIDSADYSNYLKTNDQTILGNNIATIYQSMANVWAIKSIPEEYKKCRMSDSETLIISGDLDFRTPAYITEKELMPYLTHGQHIVLQNMSHRDIFMNVMKSPDFLSNYFDSGIADKKSISSIEKIDFTPKSKISKPKLFFVGLFM